MSLKLFHICFISFVTLFFVAYSLWAFFLLPDTLPQWIRGSGFVTAAAAVIAVVYGIWFYRKAKHLIV